MTEETEGHMSLNREERIAARGRMVESLRYALKQPLACITRQELGALLGVSKEQVKVLVDAGKLPKPISVAAGRRFADRFRVRDIIKWIESGDV